MTEDRTERISRKVGPQKEQSSWLYMQRKKGTVKRLVVHSSSFEKEVVTDSKTAAAVTAATATGS